MAIFQFDDKNAEPGVTYYYWLEIVGEAEVLGPVSVAVPVSPSLNYVYLPVTSTPIKGIKTRIS